MSGIEAPLTYDVVMAALKIVVEGIKNVRTIAEAIKDSEKYIKEKHKKIGDDLLIMLNEMQKSLLGLALASQIVTDFRFTVSGSAMENEPTRFNKEIMDRRKKVENLKNRLKSLQGSCNVIMMRADKLDKKAEEKGIIGGMMKFFNLESEEREENVRHAIRQINNREKEFHNIVSYALNQVDKALNDVQLQLGPRGMADPKNVPKAAKLLGKYAMAFEEVENQANDELSIVENLVLDFNRGKNI